MVIKVIYRERNRGKVFFVEKMRREKTILIICLHTYKITIHLHNQFAVSCILVNSQKFNLVFL